MDKLSFELVEQIAAHLDAGDALALAAVCRATRAGSLSRLDPATYLRSTFKDPKSLLAAMTDLGCVLSGSRALEFFVPGSLDETARPSGSSTTMGDTDMNDDAADADNGEDHETQLSSDWDFLVPCSRNSVVGMMAALETAGVRWPHPLEALLDLFEHPVASPGSTVYVPVAALTRLPVERLARDPRVSLCNRTLSQYHNLHIHACLLKDVKKWMGVYARLPEEDDMEETHGEPVYLFQVLSWKQVLRRCVINGHGSLASDNIAAVAGYSYGLPTSVWPVKLINGTVRVPGRPHCTAKVQLFQCHLQSNYACTPLEYIANTYYATHVQCFLGGWCAGHFFYDLAAARQALAWFGGAAKRADRQKCIAKYRARGYRFFDARQPLDELDDAMNPATHPALGTLPARQDTSQDSQDATTTWTPEPLTPAGHRALRQAAELGKTAAARLGQPGTLLIQFGQLQDQVVEAAQSLDQFIDVRSVPQSTQLRTMYRQLGQALDQFRFSQTRGTLNAIERPMPRLARRREHWAITAERGEAAAAPGLGGRKMSDRSGPDSYGVVSSEKKPLSLWPLPDILARGTPPSVTGVAHSLPSMLDRPPTAMHYEALLCSTPTACSFVDCDEELDFLPPQL